VHAELSYQHPIFDKGALRAQAELAKIQGQNNIFWCGAWTANGFHEDGLKSAVAVAKTLKMNIPWSSPTQPYKPAPAGLDLPRPDAAGLILDT